MLLSQDSTTHSYSSSQTISPSWARETSVVLTPAWCSNTDGPPRQPRVPSLSGNKRPLSKVTSPQLSAGKLLTLLRGFFHSNHDSLKQLANCRAYESLVTEMEVGRRQKEVCSYQHANDAETAVIQQSCHRPSRKTQHHMAQRLLPSPEPMLYVTTPSFFTLYDKITHNI